MNKRTKACETVNPIKEIKYINCFKCFDATLSNEGEKKLYKMCQKFNTPFNYKKDRKIQQILIITTRE